MHLKAEDTNVRRTVNLTTPKELKFLFPSSNEQARHVLNSRRAIEDILARRDKRLLAIVGPCSIHDAEEARQYAAKLQKLSHRIEDSMFVVMRVYFEKPRTTIGWKGLINDPDLDGSHDIEKGLRIARRLLLSIADLKIPAATEFLDPIVPQFIADLISWVAIGARTTESQTHREMASGLSMPVGFKNGTDGTIDTAANAMLSSRTPHQFLGIDADGVTSIIRTAGNSHAHLVLRGGRFGGNYDSKSLKHAALMLRGLGLPPNLLIDCSHDNSQKRSAYQPKVLSDVIRQKVKGNPDIIGFMIESNHFEGRQAFPSNTTPLRRGISITDECLSFEQTEEVLLKAHKSLQTLA